MFPNIERDALKALKTAGGWAHVRRRCPSRDQGEFWRVDPTPTMQGALWTVRRQAGLPPGAMSQSWLTELLGWGVVARLPSNSSPARPVRVCGKPGDGTGGHVSPCVPQEEPQGGPHSGGVCHLLPRRAGHAHRGEGVGACRWVLGRRRSQGGGVTVLLAGEAAAVMPGLCHLGFRAWGLVLSQPGKH